MRSIIAAAALLALTACVEDVGKDKVKAQVEDIVKDETPAKVETPAKDQAPAGKTLKVDAANSHINALGAKVTATHPIVWKSFTGEVAVDGDTLTSISFSVDMNSMEADVPKLTSHLKDADFFDVEKFPTATFKSTEIKAGAPEGTTGTHTVAGEFMVHGMTKQLTFPATVTITPEQVKAETEFVIDRNVFGITYKGRADDLIQDNVKMNIDFVAPRS